MRFARAAWPVFAGSCLVLLVASACGSTAGSNVNGDANGDGSGAGNGKAGKSGTAGPMLGDLGGDGATLAGGSSAIGPECAGELIQAQRIPLDMYVMLDVSGSMLEPTTGNANISKWSAVSSALSDFVSDPGSDGIGVGLQVFPIADPRTPAMCTTDQECGAHGPCLNRICLPPGNGPLVGCLNDSQCSLAQTCSVTGVCSKNDQYLCDRSLGPTCTTNRGNCVVPPSVCLIGDDCRPATYAVPAAEIAALPAARAALVGVLSVSTPVKGALTPTGPALSGAIQHANDWAKTHTDHQVVAVLATDGTPTLQTNGTACEAITLQSQVDAVAKIAAKGETATPSIATFVIGVIGPDDTGAVTTLRSIAQSGGTKKAFIVDTMGNVQMQFRDALNQIRATGLACELVVPQAEAGKTVDYLKVNVTFDNGSGPSDLGYVESAANCDAATGGWYYDVDPSAGKPQRIQTCPATCADFEKTDMGSVQIKLGCVTRNVVK